jgi:hypothetical protein
VTERARTSLAVRLSAAAATVLLFAIATVTKADPDLWGHLRFGLDTITARGLTSVDPYSFTQDVPWINHEWLSEVMTALAWIAGGVAGLALLKGALVGASIVNLWRAFRGVDFPARFVACAAVAVAIAPLARTLRPQLWTLLFVTILCRVLLAEGMRLRLLLPPLFAFWANLHGGWTVGLGILLAWTSVDVVMRAAGWMTSAALAAVCVLSTLVTPYGWHLWSFIASTVRMGRDITEWQPLWKADLIDTAPWVVTVIASAWLVRYAPSRRLARLAVLVMLAYASARVIRIGPLFAMTAGLMLADACRQRWPAPVARRLVDPTPLEPVAAAVIAALALGASFWVGSSSLRCINVPRERAADPAAMNLLRSAQPGRLVTFFDWGEFALWHLGPRLRVSMDGRRETIYSDARLAEHAAILDGQAAGLRMLAEWAPEYIWLPATSDQTRAWLVSEGYRVEYQSDRSFVAVRPDLPRLDWRYAANPVAAACFPG